ncbi:MAG: exostosin family protein [Verrucomicrobiota bacterium]
MPTFAEVARRQLDPAKVRSDYLSAEQYQKGCEQVWSTDKRSLVSSDRRAPESGAVVYAKRDHAKTLFPLLRKSRSRIVLVTAESDEAVSVSDAIPPQVARWFSTNSAHPAVRQLPLGLGNSYCPVTAKADSLAEACGARKSGLLYLNFRPATNSGARQTLWESYSGAEREGWGTRRAGDVSRQDYVMELASHRFALCPPGNGTDTHRMWEALYVGTIPVVQKSPALESFSDLPILFVDCLEGLSKSFLEDREARMACEEWSWDKLFVPWWIQRFTEARAGMKACSPRLSLMEFFFSGLSQRRLPFAMAPAVRK